MAGTSGTQGKGKHMNRPIQLHCDLAVDPQKEDELVRYSEWQRVGSPYSLKSLCAKW